MFTVTVRFKQKWECVDKFYYNSTATDFLKIHFVLHEFFVHTEEQMGRTISEVSLQAGNVLKLELRIKHMIFKT